MSEHTVEKDVPLCPVCGGNIRFCECMDDPFAAVPESAEKYVGRQNTRAIPPAECNCDGDDGETGHDLLCPRLDTRVIQPAKPSGGQS